MQLTNLLDDDVKQEKVAASIHTIHARPARPTVSKDQRQVSALTCARSNLTPLHTHIHSHEYT